MSTAPADRSRTIAVIVAAGDSARERAAAGHQLALTAPLRQRRMPLTDS